jgi:hypothetical protein
LALPPSTLAPVVVIVGRSNNDRLLLDHDGRRAVDGGGGIDGRSDKRYREADAYANIHMSLRAGRCNSGEPRQDGQRQKLSHDYVSSMSTAYLKCALSLGRTGVQGSHERKRTE